MTTTMSAQQQQAPAAGTSTCSWYLVRSTYSYSIIFSLPHRNLLSLLNMAGALVWAVLVGVLGLCLQHAFAFNCIAMSGSGQHMLLASYHNLVSSDFGVTFDQIPDFLTLMEWWYGCAVDESGQHMALGSQMSGLYVSADFGKTWTKTKLSSADNWGWITMSATGDRMAAIYSENADYQGLGHVMATTDAGLTWTDTHAYMFVYMGIISDYSGQFLATIAHNFEQTTGIVLTFDSVSGNWTFVNTAPYDRYYALTADSKAQYLLISGEKGVHVSADRGLTWTTSKNPVQYVSRLASSASGQQVLAAGYNRELYASADFGQSWSVALNRNDSWHSVASNADFTVLAAVSSFNVYVSRDGGATWTSPPLNTPSPSLRPSQKPITGRPSQKPITSRPSLPPSEKP